MRIELNKRYFKRKLGREDVIDKKREKNTKTVKLRNEVEGE